MPLTLNPRAEALRVSGIRQFFNQLVNYPDAINLTIGQPDFPTPEPVKEAGKAAISANLTGYTHNAGLLELRQEIASLTYLSQVCPVIHFLCWAMRYFVDTARTSRSVLSHPILSATIPKRERESSSLTAPGMSMVILRGPAV